MSVTTMIEQNNNNSQCDVHLHTELNVLKQTLIDKQNQLIAMETACLRESDRQAELEDSIIAWQDKYDRLYDSHKRVQKLNQNLEDKLLKLVDRNSNERAQLTSDVATLSVRLAQANYNIGKLQREIERYKTDINLAIQLLQCKPESFVPQKVSSLPMDIQSKVSSYMRLETASHSDSEDNISGVGVVTSGSYKVLPASDSPPPVCPFPPTAMVYSMRGLDAKNSNCTNLSNNGGNNNNNNNNNYNKSSDQMISPSIVAKYLENELKTNEIKHCDTCKCSTNDLTVLAIDTTSSTTKTYNVSTQTINHDGLTSLCLRCNSNLNSPSRTNSPFVMKLMKSNDSIISETKSTASISDDIEHKIFLPPKKDDLMVNPILGHHRLCERTTIKIHQKQHHYHHLLQQQNEQKTQQELMQKQQRNLTSTTSAIAEDLIDLQKSSDKVFHNGDDYFTNGSVNNKLESKTVNGKMNDYLQGKNKSDNNIKSNHKRINGKLGNIEASSSSSVTSLWSKNSDGEGAKLFETFNRNLIKTIKADNPKHRGPRLCAMRIQSNGSSNILLDNIESEITPIIYTRRPKFLDEELDDKKDIITSKSSYDDTMLSQQYQTNCPLSIDSGNNQSNPNPSNNSIIDMENICSLDDLNNSQAIAGPPNDQNEIDKLTDIQLITFSTTSIVKNLMDQQLEELKILGNDAKLPAMTTAIIPKHETINCNDISRSGDIVDGRKGVDGGGGGGNSSCKNSKTTCTQSSSFSEIDLQESALLRRQQLNRVAEWVQNNSKIECEKKNALQLQQQQQQQQQGDNTILSSDNPIDGKIYYNKNCQFENIPVKNFSSFEKLSIDSGYKTTNNKNQYHESILEDTNNFIKFSFKNDTNCEKSAQNNFMSNDNYYNFDMNENLDQHLMHYNGGNIEEEGNIDNIELHHRRQQGEQQSNVDLAQMEYNVKQFLLKQNEWSIQNLNDNSNYSNSNNLQQQCKSPISSSSISCRTAGDGRISSGEEYNFNSSSNNKIESATPDLIASNKFTSAVTSTNEYQLKFVRNYPQRTETNL